MVYKNLVIGIADSADEEDLACVHFSTVAEADEMDDHVKLNLAVRYGFDVSDGKITLPLLLVFTALV